MNHKNRLVLWGILAAAAIFVIGAGSYALAQSGNGDQQLAQAQGQGEDTPGAVHDFVSRHVDYDVTIDVNGDLTSADPKLKGVLPLKLSATGGADIKKGDNGPSVQGNLRLTGIDDVISKLVAGNAAASGYGNGTTARTGLIAGIINGALANLDYVMVDHHLYLKVGDVWYNADPKMGNQAGRGQDQNSDKPANGEKQTDKNDKACMAGAFPDGPKALLKDQQTIGQEDIDGASTTHYSATVDVAKAISNAATAARNCGKTDEAARLESAQKQINGALKELKLEWWQDGDDQLRQVKAAIEVEPATLASLASQATGDKEASKVAGIFQGISSIKLNATLKFSQFNDDFQINKPDGDIKPLPFLKGISGHGRCQKHYSAAGSAWHKGNRHGGQPSSAAAL